MLGIIFRIASDWLRLEWRRRPAGIPFAERSRADTHYPFKRTVHPVRSAGPRSAVLRNSVRQNSSAFLEKVAPRRPAKGGRRSCAAPWSASFGWHLFHRFGRMSSLSHHRLTPYNDDAYVEKRMPSVLNTACRRRKGARECLPIQSKGFFPLGSLFIKIYFLPTTNPRKPPPTHTHTPARTHSIRAINKQIRGFFNWPMAH